MLRMLDQVRSEFGVEVEIVDANLAAAWSPEGQRQIRVLAGPELRAVGLGVLREGRSSVVSVDGREYRLVPLRSNRSVLPTALLAMRVMAPAGRPAGSPGESDTDRHALDVEPWVEVLRGAIEADLSSREEIDGERQQARAVRGALRFVTYLAAARTEAELADAAIQAAAVWFDADARVYRRRPGGDYALFASLPGAQVPIEGRRLTGLDLGGEPLVRAAHLAGLPGGRDGIVVPIAGADPAQWALVLLGTMPPEAEVTLEALGRVLGVQMERLALGRVDTIRHRFEEIVAGPSRAVELTAMDVLRDLIAQAHGTAAALWIAHGDDARRMAAVGEAREDMSHADALPPEQRSTATVQVRTVKLGPSRSARLELRATGDAPFESDVPQIVDACASVLRGWLAAAVRPEPAAVPLLLEAPAPDFARRIEEELARAKRFDRDLAIVVIDPATRQWPASVTNKVVDVLREELRGSDVLGLIGERRVVVLLIETKETGMGTVVERLRQRLGRAMPELKVPALVLGQAAFSRECATADALLTAAAVNAETITVPAA
jgi:hypothetical protein